MPRHAREVVLAVQRDEDGPLAAWTSLSRRKTVGRWTRVPGIRRLQRRTGRTRTTLAPGSSVDRWIG